MSRRGGSYEDEDYGVGCYTPLGIDQIGRLTRFREQDPRRDDRHERKFRIARARLARLMKKEAAN